MFDAAGFVRLSSQAMSAIIGGMAIFNLYYAGQVSDHDFALSLFLGALQWGGLATAVVYFQGKYLDR
jgi:hypothetical protein